MAQRPDARYVQLAEQFRDRIRNGQWPIGKPIPSRRKLAETTGQSEPTVQRALRMLQQDGVLGGRKGSAVTVIAHPDTPARWLVRPGSDSLGRPASALGITYEYATGTENADETIARRLGITPGDQVMGTTYEIMRDLRPVYIVRSWEPLELTRNTEVAFPEDGHWAGKGVAARMARIGIAVTAVEEDPLPRPATPEEEMVLGLRPGELVFEITRTHFGNVSGTERPVETADIIVSAERYRLRYRIPLG